MKLFNKKIIVLFFLLIIVLSNIAETTLVSKAMRANYKRSLNKKLTKNKRTHDGESIFKFIENFRTQDYFMVFLGFLSEFFPVIKPIYDKIKAVKDYTDHFKDCYTKIVAAKDDISDAKKIFDKATENLNSPENKKNYCLKVKAQVKMFAEQRKIQAFNKLAKENEQSFLLGGGLGLTYMASNIKTGELKDYINNTVMASGKINGIKILENCNSAASADEPRIIRLYGNRANFIQQCSYFLRKDCNAFNPTIGDFTSFAQKAWNVAKSISKAKDCIIKTFTESKLIPTFGLTEILTSIVGSIVENAVGAVANILSFGIWGGLKAAYYIIQLGFKIADFSKKNDLYLLGQIIADATLIIKSIIAGRKKRKGKY